MAPPSVNLSILDDDSEDNEEPVQSSQNADNRFNTVIYRPMTEPAMVFQAVHGSPRFYDHYIQFYSSSGDRPEMTHKVTDRYLNNELEGATQQNYSPEDLIEYVFSDKKLQLPVAEIFDELSGKVKTKKRRLPLYGMKNGILCWLNVPKLEEPAPQTQVGMREYELGKFIIEIATEGHVGYPISVDRGWTAHFCDDPLPTDSSIQRMPDLIGVKREHLYKKRMRRNARRHLKWEHVDVLVELTCGKKSTYKELHNELQNKSFCMFQAQVHRRFICALAFKQHNACFSVYDRSGVVRTKSFNIHKKPILFLRLVLGMTYGKDSVIGLDTTIIKNPLIETSTITINGKVYKIVRVLWRGDMIRGRATTCLLVKLDDEYFVVKSSWVVKGRRPTEVYYLNKAKMAGVKGITHLVSAEVVSLDGHRDTCENNRGVCNILEDRIHQRYVFKECGLPITHFRNQIELLLAFADCIESHCELLKKAHILHRDISIWNLMLRVNFNNVDDKKRREGLLIDLDYSKDLDEDRPNYLEDVRKLDLKCTEGTSISNDEAEKGHRTGTRPFMAAEILDNVNVEHNEHHDLESFFYVFLYICVHFDGPNQHFADIPKTPSFFENWLTMSFGNVAMSKNGLLLDAQSLHATVAKHFTSYFQNLLSCANQLRLACRDKKPHETFIKILRETAKALETDPPSGPSPSDPDKRVGFLGGLTVYEKAPDDAAKAVLKSKIRIPDDVNKYGKNSSSRLPISLQEAAMKFYVPATAGDIVEGIDNLEISQPNSPDRPSKNTRVHKLPVIQITDYGIAPEKADTANLQWPSKS